MFLKQATQRLATTAVLFAASQAFGAGTAFTYQGQLKQAGSPVNAGVNMTFDLWDAATLGAQQGSTLTFDGVGGNPASITVSNGLFSVQLDFGVSPYAVNLDRWLEITVNGQLLSPRQPLTPAPFALNTRGINVSAAGNVGVGTTAPGNKLEVTAASNGDGIRVTGSTAPLRSPGYQLYDATTQRGTLGLAEAATAFSTDALAGDIVLRTNTGKLLLQNGVGSSAMAITSNDLGIGTTTPAARLEVDSDQSGKMGLIVKGFPAQTANLQEWRDGLGATLASVSATGALTASVKVPYGSQAAPAIAFTDDSDTGLYGISGEIRLALHGATVMAVRPSPGGVGICALDGHLHVDSREIIPGFTVATFNRNADDGTIIDLEQDGISVGSISVAGTTVSYNAFTGSHYAWTDQKIERGTLVTLTGVNRRLHDDPASELLYGIAPSEVANDPLCLGAYLALQEPNQAGGAANPHLVMAVGNGEMWVVDGGNGDVRAGDYLISSDVSGCAMKDDPGRFAVGHIVARAAEPVTWDRSANRGTTLNRKRISVLFGNFVRGGQSAAFEKRVESQDARIGELESQIRAMQSNIESISHDSKLNGLSLPRTNAVDRGGS